MRMTPNKLIYKQQNQFTSFFRRIKIYIICEIYKYFWVSIDYMTLTTFSAGGWQSINLFADSDSDLCSYRVNVFSPN